MILIIKSKCHLIFHCPLVHREWNEEIMTVERASYADIYIQTHILEHTYTFAFIFSLSSACSRSVGHSRQPSARDQTHTSFTLSSINRAQQGARTKRPQAIRKWIFQSSPRAHTRTDHHRRTPVVIDTKRLSECNLPTYFCGGGNLDFFVAAKARLGYCVRWIIYLWECAKIYILRARTLLMLSICSHYYARSKLVKGMGNIVYACYFVYKATQKQQ